MKILLTNTIQLFLSYSTNLADGIHHSFELFFQGCVFRALICHDESIRIITCSNECLACTCNCSIMHTIKYLFQLFQFFTRNICRMFFQFFEFSYHFCARSRTDFLLYYLLDSLRCLFCCFIRFFYYCLNCFCHYFRLFRFLNGSNHFFGSVFDFLVHSLSHFLDSVFNNSLNGVFHNFRRRFCDRLSGVLHSRLFGKHLSEAFINSSFWFNFFSGSLCGHLFFRGSDDFFALYDLFFHMDV